MTPKKKSKTKSRIFAAFFAVLVLATVAIIPAMAYPAQSYIPLTGTYNLPDRTQAQQFQHIAEHNLLGQQVGNQWEYTFIPDNLRFSAGVDWSYISYQLSIADDNGNEYGHYTIGGYLDSNGNVVYRIGWMYTIDDVAYSSFPYVEESEGALHTMLGYRITRLSSGRSVLDMELVRYDTNGVIQQTGYVSVEMPEQAKKVYLQIKTNYADTSGSMIDNTVDAPHTPIDLLYMGEAYDKGEQDLADSGQVVVNGIWQIISMPFDIVSNLLNFEIFGLNLWNTATAIITIALIVWVLKKVGVF